MNPLHHPRISMDAHRRFGRPTLSGTRYTVADVLGQLAAGEPWPTW